MKLFLIRNMYTAIMANSILDQVGEDTYGIAVLIAPNVTDSVKIYQDQLEKILRRSKKWTNILRLTPLKNNIPSWNKFALIYYQKHRILDRIETFEQIFENFKVNEIVISQLGDIINENPLFFVSQNKGINCSLYDETLYKGYIVPIFNQKKFQRISIIKQLKKIIKDVVNLIYLQKIKNVIDINISSTKIEFNNYYSLFPKLYPYNNLKKQTKILPTFPTYPVKAKSILLTSSYSEDSILSLEEEIELIKNISAILPKDTQIRFHPRDSLIKQNRILETTGYKELEIDIEASEYIIHSPKLKILSGYICSTLFVASELRPNLEINSFVGIISNQVINKAELKAISLDFPNIKFHGLI